MELNIDATFEGKLTCALKNDMRNLAGELCVLTMKNDAKIEEELTCQFKIDMRNLMNFDLST